MMAFGRQGAFHIGGDDEGRRVKGLFLLGFDGGAGAEDARARGQAWRR